MGTGLLFREFRFFASSLISSSEVESSAGRIDLLPARIGDQQPLDIQREGHGEGREPVAGNDYLVQTVAACLLPPLTQRARSGHPA